MNRNLKLKCCRRCKQLCLDGAGSTCSQRINGTSRHGGICNCRSTKNIASSLPSPSPSLDPGLMPSSMLSFSCFAALQISSPYCSYGLPNRDVSAVAWHCSDAIRCPLEAEGGLSCFGTRCDEVPFGNSTM